MLLFQIEGKAVGKKTIAYIRATSFASACSKADAILKTGCKHLKQFDSIKTIECLGEIN
jgi:hypothetical protein